MIASAEMASAFYTGMKKFYMRYSGQKINNIPWGCNTSGAAISTCYPLKPWGLEKLGAGRLLAHHQLRNIYLKLVNNWITVSG